MRLKLAMNARSNENQSRLICLFFRSPSWKTVSKEKRSKGFLHISLLIGKPHSRCLSSKNLFPEIESAFKRLLKRSQNWRKIQALTSLRIFVEEYIPTLRVLNFEPWLLCRFRFPHTLAICAVPFILPATNNKRNIEHSKNQILETKK